MIVPRHFEDLSILCENTLPERSYFIPASKRMGALVENRTLSDRFQLLNGNWSFRFFSSIEDVTEEFYRPDYDISGFDTIPQSAEDAGTVKRSSLGKVIIAAMAFAGMFYVLNFLSTGVAYPWLDTVDLPRPTLSNLFLLLYPGALGKILYAISTIATVAGLFSTWNGFFVGATHLMLGMSREGLLPTAFSRIHRKFKTPYVCNLFCGVIMLAGPFLSVNIIDPLTTLSSAGHVIGWGIVCLSAARLRRSKPDLDRPYKMSGGRTTAIVASIVCGLILLDCVIPPSPGYMRPIGMWAFVVWSALGLVFFWFCRKR